MLILKPSRLDHPHALAMINDVQQYYIEIYGGPDSEPLDPSEFAEPKGGFLIGYVDDEPVAMGGWSFREDKTAAKVRRMYVAPRARRRGYAAQLLAALEASAAAAGASQMILTTGQPQQDAIALYRANGYTDIAAYGHYADSHSAVHLGKALLISDNKIPPGQNGTCAAEPDSSLANQPQTAREHKDEDVTRSGRTGLTWCRWCPGRQQHCPRLGRCGV